jgi:hypothetical protein
MCHLMHAQHSCAIISNSLPLIIAAEQAKVKDSTVQAALVQNRTACLSQRLQQLSPQTMWLASHN